MRIVLVLLTLAAASIGASVPQKPVVPRPSTTAANVMWRDRGDPAALDLVNGAGGRAHAPDPAGTFTFIREDAAATNPKFDVVDAKGVEWKVKLDEESQPEVAATRFVWAAGYFTDEDYYVADLTVAGLSKLHRGEKFVSPGGIVHGARLERKIVGEKKAGNWDWFDNPFAGQQTFNGLRVMMALLNNWDLKTINNEIYEVNGERRYVVADLGAAFGHSGNAITRSKSNIKDYEASTFIDGPTAGLVNFTMHSRPFFLWMVNPSNYRARTQMTDITKLIPREDAQWLGRRLAALSETQIRDGFRAAGYSPDEVDAFARVVLKRIAELNAL